MRVRASQMEEQSLHSASRFRYANMYYYWILLAVHIQILALASAFCLFLECFVSNRIIHDAREPRILVFLLSI